MNTRPAQRVDFLFVDIIMIGQRMADLGLEILKRGLGQRKIAARLFDRPVFAFIHVVFVFNLSDDLFDQVFDGHQTVNAAVFVDHQRHVPPLGLHLGQQHPDRHGRGHKQQGPQHGRQIEWLGIPVKAMGQREILEVGHPHGRVQRAIIDRQPRQTTFLEYINQFIQGRGDWNSGDIRLGHRDIVHTHPAQVHHTPRRQPIRLGQGGLVFFNRLGRAERPDHPREKTAGFLRLFRFGGVCRFYLVLELRAVRRLR